jgi:hypothetical protein
MQSFSLSDHATLEFSQQPAERNAQVRILKDLIALYSKPTAGAASNRDQLVHLSETPAMKVLSDLLLAEIPESEGFGSFDELKSQRDASGVVRLRS